MKLVRYYVTKALRSIVKIFPLSGEGLRERVLLKGCKIRIYDATHVALLDNSCQHLSCIREDAAHAAMPEGQRKCAFTLAEVLITLGIIGVVTAMTLPSVINDSKDKEFKTAYKKAYSDLSRVMLPAYTNGDLPLRTEQFEPAQTKKEFDYIKQAFKVIKSCEPENLYDCWPEGGEGVCSGSCATGSSDDGLGDPNEGYPKKGLSVAFVDVSGRIWATYTISENIFIVDVNGKKSPNKFGKDRWLFTFANKDNIRVPMAPSDIVPVKIIPYRDYDYETESAWCHYPPCYFKSWLYE